MQTPNSRDSYEFRNLRTNQGAFYRVTQLDCGQQSTGLELKIIKPEPFIRSHGPVAQPRTDERQGDSTRFRNE